MKLGDQFVEVRTQHRASII